MNIYEDIIKPLKTGLIIGTLIGLTFNTIPRVRKNIDNIDKSLMEIRYELEELNTSQEEKEKIKKLFEEGPKLHHL